VMPRISRAGARTGSSWTTSGLLVTAIAAPQLTGNGATGSGSKGTKKRTGGGTRPVRCCGSGSGYLSEPHLSGQVLRLPSFMPARAALIFVCASGAQWLLLLWPAATPMPSFLASYRVSPGAAEPSEIFLIESETASSRLFVALVSRHGAAFGYDRYWSTSTPMPRIGGLGPPGAAGAAGAGRAGGP